MSNMSMHPCPNGFRHRLRSETTLPPDMTPWVLLPGCSISRYFYGGRRAKPSAGECRCGRVASVGRSDLRRGLNAGPDMPLVRLRAHPLPTNNPRPRLSLVCHEFASFEFPKGRRSRATLRAPPHTPYIFLPPHIPYSPRSFPTHPLRT